MNNQDVTLQLDDISKRFDEFTAVDDLNLEVRRGRIFGLLGPNGAGKTTTIRMIVRITMPDTGRIEIFGEPLGQKHQARIGYLPEERGLYKKMRVGEQIKFFGELKGMTGTDAQRAADAWLERMNLSEWKVKKADELSKGMQQKIQFITTVMHKPDLIILDEPFSGLDPVNAELLKEIVLELKADGRTIIFSTHMMEQAEQLCDDICLLNRSRKVLEGTVRDLKRNARRNVVALRATGAGAVLDDESLVAKVKRMSEDEVEISLHAETDAQSLLARLVESGAQITKFELVEPSLHEIFIEKVGETS